MGEDMGNIIIAIGLAVIAGAVNASFMVPHRPIKNVKEEKLWFVFSWWGFLIIPIISCFILNVNFIKCLSLIPPTAFIIPLIGGAIWGAGMICMSLAFRYVGIGVVFVVNIGLGTAGGTLIPLIFLHPEKIGTTFSYLVFAGVLLFIAGVIYAAKAASERDKYKNSTISEGQKNAVIGVILSILAGISSAIQGSAFAIGASGLLQNELLTGYNPLLISTIPWLVIFIGGFITYMLYFLAVNIKKGNFTKPNKEKIGLKNYICIILMGILFFICVIFYSKSTLMLGDLGRVVGWPIYMCFIVLISNFWGFKFGEWKGAGKVAGKRIALAITCLIVAVVVLSIAAKIS
jgi:L-rhamnose-H+ transport protein